MKTLVLALVVGLLVSGCAGVGGMAGLSAEQLNALAKVKDANVICFEATAALYGSGTLVSASIDKGIVATIRINGHGKCDVEMTTESAK